MKLSQLKLDNFRCFQSLNIKFSDITLVLADNGGGKSTILEAIKLAFGSYLTRFPDISGVSPVRDKHILMNEDGKLAPYLRILSTLDDNTSWDRTERRDKTKKTASQIPVNLGLKQLHEFADKYIDNFNDNIEFTLPLVLYYGTERAFPEVMPERRRNWKKMFTPFDALDEALSGKANFRRFLEWFNEMESQERRERLEKRDFDYSLPALDVVRKAIESMIPDISNPRIETTPFRFIVDFNGVEFRMDQLSDGYRMTLAMVADIAGRLAEANPHMENPLTAPGIVLIDEVDQHLHPKWQRTIVSDLHRTFPNIQFILSTHSPIIAIGAPEVSSIIHLTKEHNVETLSKHTIDSFSVNRVLVSHLFGLPNPQNPSWDDKIKRREDLLKENSDIEISELDTLNEELSLLSIYSAEDLEARTIIREAANLLKNNQG